MKVTRTLIAERAVAWADARRLVASLRRQRNGSECEHEWNPDGSDADESFAAGHPNAGLACWKLRYTNDESDSGQAPDDEWCEPCRIRQRLHEEYRTAVKDAGRLQSALMRVTARR